MENLFDVLASCLLLEENKAVFVEAEGEYVLVLQALPCCYCCCCCWRRTRRCLWRRKVNFD